MVVPLKGQGAEQNPRKKGEQSLEKVKKGGGIRQKGLSRELTKKQEKKKKKNKKKQKKKGK